MNTFHLAVVIIAIGVVVIACLSGIFSLMMATGPTDQSGHHRPARIDLKVAWLWLRSRCSPAAGRLTRLTPWLLATSKGSNDPQ